MKAIRLWVILLFAVSAPHATQAQVVQPHPVDCNTDFWTITADGYIQQWSMINGVISGGDTVLSGGGTSLGYCGTSGSPTFYTNNYIQVGISRFDPVAGWVTTTTYSVVNNNGGHLGDQYYMVEGAVIQVVKYWNGTTLSTVDSLQGEFFAGTHDIAVDTAGQAWVFTGSVPSSADSVKVYNQNGRVNAYPIQFTQTFYGSFFLNDTLYVGSYQDSLYPVIITGSTAQLGNPAFFADGSFTDMASCQETSPTTIPEHDGASWQVYPNPFRDFLMLPVSAVWNNITVFDAQGHEVRPIRHGRKLDFSGYPAGIYMIRITRDGLPVYQKVIKL